MYSQNYDHTTMHYYMHFYCMITYDLLHVILLHVMTILLHTALNVTKSRKQVLALNTLLSGCGQISTAELSAARRFTEFFIYIYICIFIFSKMFSFGYTTYKIYIKFGYTKLFGYKFGLFRVPWLFLLQFVPMQKFTLHRNKRKNGGLTSAQRVEKGVIS